MKLGIVSALQMMSLECVITFLSCFFMIMGQNSTNNKMDDVGLPIIYIPFMLTVIVQVFELSTVLVILG